MALSQVSRVPFNSEIYSPWPVFAAIGGAKIRSHRQRKVSGSVVRPPEYEILVEGLPDDAGLYEYLGGI